MNRTCTKCHQDKPDSEFYKNKVYTDGLCLRCKSCMCAYRYTYRIENRDKIIAYRRVYIEKNRDRINCQIREMRRRSGYNKKYYEINREQILQKKKSNVRKRSDTSIASKKYRAKHKDSLKIKYRSDSKKAVQRVSNKYCKHLLANHCHSTISKMGAIPAELIELKRNCIILKRELKKIKDDRSNSNV